MPSEQRAGHATRQWKERLKLRGYRE